MIFILPSVKEAYDIRYALPDTEQFVESKWKVYITKIHLITI